MRAVDVIVPSGIPPKDYPREVLQEFARRAQTGDKQAVLVLIESVRDMMRFQAYKYARNKTQVDDLIAAATLIVVKDVIPRFRKDCGVGSFRHYAEYYIRSAIREEWSIVGSTISRSGFRRRVIAYLHELSGQLHNTLGRLPTEAELYAAAQKCEIPSLVTRLTRTTVRHFLIGECRETSAETPLYAEGFMTLRDTLSHVTQTPEQSTVRTEFVREAEKLLLVLQQQLRIMSARDREIIIRRYGLHGTSPETLEEIGKLFQLSRERVRQLEFRFIERLMRIFKMDKKQVIALLHYQHICEDVSR